MKLTIKKTVEVTPCTYKEMCRAISHGNWDPGWDPVVMRRMKMSKARLYAQLLADNYWEECDRKNFPEDFLDEVE